MAVSAELMADSGSNQQEAREAAVEEAWVAKVKDSNNTSQNKAIVWTAVASREDADTIKDPTSSIEASSLAKTNISTRPKESKGANKNQSRNATRNKKGPKSQPASQSSTTSNHRMYLRKKRKVKPSKMSLTTRSSI